ncbi:MAG: SCO family protein [Alcanivoracaceae bacterium]|nr:SCO family protein [Alcanivoracaceae bacterium]
MQQRTRNMLMLALIVAPFAATILFVRLFVDPADMDSANKGNLIVPHVQLAALAPAAEDGSAYTAEQTAGQWSMVYIANGHCEQACKNALFYLMRQLRLSLDTDTPRVRRVIVHTDTPDEGMRDFLDNNVAGMVEVTAAPDAVRAAFASVFDADETAIGKIYIMSPDAQIFLWYPSHDAQQDVLLEADRIRADLKRILKGSLIG